MKYLVVMTEDTAIVEGRVTFPCAGRIANLDIQYWNNFTYHDTQIQFAPTGWQERDGSTSSPHGVSDRWYNWNFSLTYDGSGSSPNIYHAFDQKPRTVKKGEVWNLIMDDSQVGQKFIILQFDFIPFLNAEAQLTFRSPITAVDNFDNAWSSPMDLKDVWIEIDMQVVGTSLIGYTEFKRHKYGESFLSNTPSAGNNMYRSDNTSPNQFTLGDTIATIPMSEPHIRKVAHIPYLRKSDKILWDYATSSGTFTSAEVLITIRGRVASTGKPTLRRIQTNYWMDNPSMDGVGGV